HKVRSYFTQLSTDDRKIRSLNEESRRLREQLAKLEELAAAKSLYEMDRLVKTVADLTTKLESQERLAADSVHRCEMMDKIVGGENKKLRGKIHNLQSENVFLKGKIETHEDTIRERDREIASLSIYRYNAVHRKGDYAAGPCKKCERRDREENETRRRQAILERLPTFPEPKVSVPKEGTLSIECLPPAGGLVPASQQPGVRIKVRVSADPLFTAVEKEWKFEAPFKGELKLLGGHLKGFEDALDIQHLVNGRYYYVQVVATCEDVDGPATTTPAILVDGAPPAPAKPVVSISAAGRTATVRIQPLLGCGGDSGAGFSRPTAYRVFHSNDGFVDDSFLVGEVASAAVPGGPANAGAGDAPDATGTVAVGGGDEDALEYVYSVANLGELHYFRIAAVNAFGMGPPSETSDPVVLDQRPPRPAKPHVTRAGPGSIRVTASVEGHPGSRVERWKILYVRSSGSEPAREVTVEQGGAELGFTLQGVGDDGGGDGTGARYAVAVVAVNACGESEASELSDEVDLRGALAAPPTPGVEAVSVSSLAVVFGDGGVGGGGGIPAGQADTVVAAPARRKVLLLPLNGGAAGARTEAECELTEPSIVLDSLEP
ncbi:hypothetical protein HK405_010410, partial [Cladochytrium tenue]